MEQHKLVDGNLIALTTAEIAEMEARRAAPLPVPASVTMRQARLALLAVGMLDDVDTAILSLPEPQRSQASIAWEYSQEVQRHNGFVSALAPALGLTSEQLDQLFFEASAL